MYPDGQTRAVPSGKKMAVTNRDKKDSIRGRMADTGEPFNVARRKTEAGGGFFDDLSAPEPPPPRRHQPWEPPEAELPGIVSIGTLLLGRTDEVAVALTGMSAFSAGIEIFLTARIRLSASHPGEHLSGGPGDLAAARRSFRLGLQYSDGVKVTGSGSGSGRPDRDSEPAGPVLYQFAGGGGPRSFVSRWWTWPLPPAGPLEVVCEWPAFGIAESRAVIDGQLILDAAGRSVRLWPENEG
jgi:hypothetical protein